ncbi:MAG: hypothetical protein HRU19_25205 [Pseudobacteriovorax sp.]|nr:hypothetical protein [Pseudobacteriovorax sp.]
MKCFLNRILSVGILVSLVPSYAQTLTSDETWEDLLNLQNTIASSSGDTLISACKDLMMINEAGTFEGTKIQMFSESLYNLRCSSNNETRNHSLSSIEIRRNIDFHVWDEDTLCPGVEGEGPNLLCRYNPNTGNGLFVYRSSEVIDNRLRYLVCTSTASETSGGLQSKYALDANCIISNGAWGAASRGVDNGQWKQTTERAAFRWYHERNFKKPVEIPIALKDQCRIGFSEALYCSPQLIIFNDTNHADITVCRLSTIRRSTSFLFIRVDDHKSKWTCSHLNFNKSLKDSFSNDERYCAPDWRGQLNPGCHLPTLAEDKHYRPVPNPKPIDR